MRFPKRIKRTLYVGIGGAGIQTLVYLKKQIKTSIGDVPKQIGFLAIDTNTTDLANQCLLAEDEKLCICVREPYERYRAEKRNSTFEYIPEENTSHLLALDRGAGQIRSNGHFAVIESQYLGKFVRVVKEKVDAIRKVQIPEESILHDSKIEVHVVSSLCGGTGSGMLLPVAALLRESIGNCELTGYFYSPEFYETLVEMSAKEVVRQNAYATIAELDYCMHYGKKRNEPITFSFGPNPEQKIRFKTRPYNEVLYIGKQTFTRGDGDVEYSYLELEDVEQLTAQMLMYSATEFLTSHISVLDNVRHKIAEGQFDRGEKVGWAMGFGMASFWFDKEKTINHSAVSLINEKIKEFLKEDEDYNARDKAYKLLCELQLNELGIDQNDEDHLINELDKNFEARVEENLIAKKNNKWSNNNDLKSVEELHTPFNLDEREKSLQNEIENSINNYLNGFLTNFQGSYHNLNKFLSQFADFLGKCESEMDKEIKGHKTDLEGFESDFKELSEKITAENGKVGSKPVRGIEIQKVTEEYDRLLSSIRGKGTREVEKEVPESDEKYNGRLGEWNMKRANAENIIKSYKERQYENAKQWAILKYESDRKTSAKSIFAGLKKNIDDKKRKIQTRIQVLQNVTGVCEKELEKLQKEFIQDTANGSNVDVPNKIRLSASINSDHLTWDALLDKVADRHDSSTMFSDITSEVMNEMRATTASLKEKVKILYDEWLHETEKQNNKGEPKKDRKLTHEMLELYKYSTPLMDVDFHGDSFGLDEFVYVIAKFADNGQKKSAPETGDMITDMLNSQFSGNTKVQPIHVDDESSVVVLRLVGAVPPYYIRGVADKVGMLSLEHSYETMKNAKVGYTPFTHTVLQKKLENKVSVLKPLKQNDRNLSLDRWINFIILGWIKKSDCDMYFLESQKFGESLNRDLKDTSKIFVLGKGREDAFDTFQRFSEELYEEYQSDYDMKLKKNEVLKNGQKYPIFEMPLDIYLDLFCLENQNLYDVDSAVYRLLNEEKERLLERAKETEKHKADEECRNAIINGSKKEEGED